MIEIIAELSGAHGGRLDNAIELIRMASISGATGVKFQCFAPQWLAERRAKHPRLKDQHEEAGLRALYEQIHTPRAWFPRLIEVAQECKLTWHASVFDPDDVAFLETLDCPRYKIASFEAHDRDIITAVMATRKPMIISANQYEDITPPAGYPILVLHATNYGVEPRSANLKRMRQWSQVTSLFGSKQWPYGLSDHTTSYHTAEIATALGARMIEWHIRLSTVHTPDDAFAWTAAAFARKAVAVRNIWEIMNADS